MSVSDSSSLPDLVGSVARVLRRSFQRQPGQDDLAGLIRAHRTVHRRANIKLLTRAYQVAARAHKGQMRKSGEPYITHPLAVAIILAELGMDTTTLIAALLHDTVEDTRYTLAQLRNDFDDEVAHLVDGVTKLEKVHFGGLAEAETTRKMILAAGRDVRVLLIKLADRLHNMRTLGAKSRASQVRIATVTQDILVPLAGRLGVQVIKRELEDLVLAVLDPQAYDDIDGKAAARADDHNRYMDGVIKQLSAALRSERLIGEVVDRPRHYTSIHERQVMEGMPDRLCDDPRVVIVIRGDEAECYAALGPVHGRWRPVPGRFKDFIAVPKYNLYKSLHTTVLGPGSIPLDVLIRTEAMHEVAEYGIAARHRQHDRHREDSRGHRRGNGQCQGCWAGESAELEWLQRLLDWQHEAESGAFLESLRYDLSDHDILVFTPIGEAVSLPAEATSVDFGYAIDTMLGDRCIGARVNGQLAPLSSPLADGDVVEILVAPSGYTGPEREWLDWVRSSRARVQIRRWFDEQEDDTDGRRESDVAAGKRAIGEALVARERLLVHDQPLTAVARAMGLSGIDALYLAVARGPLLADDVVERLITMVDAPLL